MTIDYNYLADAAKKARNNSYSPYSGFRVGAALLTDDGKVFTGCNIENSSFSVTVCAERTALFSAVSAGHRKFDAIAVSGGKGEAPDDDCVPCGICLQALSEFCSPDFRIIIAGTDNYQIKTLGELFPQSFSLNK